MCEPTCDVERQLFIVAGKPSLLFDNRVEMKEPHSEDVLSRLDAKHIPQVEPATG